MRENTSRKVIHRCFPGCRKWKEESSDSSYRAYALHVILNEVKDLLASTLQYKILRSAQNDTLSRIFLHTLDKLRERERERESMILSDLNLQGGGFMSTDAYKKFVCAILKVGVDDALRGDAKDRAWVHSQDARTLCELADIDYQVFRDAVVKKLRARAVKAGAVSSDLLSLRW